MDKMKDAGHPEGPDAVVCQQRRGRWICQDIVMKESSVDGDDAMPQIHKEEGPQQWKLTTEKADQSLKLDSQPEGDGSGKTEKGAEDGRQVPAVPGHQVIVNFPLSLDSNSNASPRRAKSRTTKTEHVPESVRQDKAEVDWLSRTELVAMAVVVCIVLFPYFVLWGSTSADSWHVLHVLWRILFQGIAVAVITVLILLGLQVHFSSYQLRQWIAKVFQLEMKGQVSADTKDRPEQVKNKKQIESQTNGDGDKSLDTDSEGPEKDISKTEKEASNNVAEAPDTVSPKEEQPCANTVCGRTEKQTSNNPLVQNQTEEQISAKTDVVACGETNEKEEQPYTSAEKIVRPANGEKRYRHAMKKMYRKFLLIRRKCKCEMSSLKRTDQEASEVLSRVQLALPVLEREKQALLAELEAIQKQHQEEKRRNHDLLTRLHRLNQQFMRIGTVQADGATSTATTQPQQEQQQQQHQHNDPNWSLRAQIPNQQRHHQLQQPSSSLPAHKEEDTPAEAHRNLPQPVCTASLPYFLTPGQQVPAQIAVHPFLQQQLQQQQQQQLQKRQQQQPQQKS